jgi:hypothetical protein
MDGIRRVESSQTPARGPQFGPNVQKSTIKYVLLIIYQICMFSQFSLSHYHTKFQAFIPKSINETLSYEYCPRDS